MTFICVLTLLLAFAPAAGGSPSALPQGRMTVAVMKFNANDCPASLSRALADMIAGKLYHSELFVLLERSEMDLIIREQGYADMSCSDSRCAAHIGRLLSVEKMIFGSVSRLDTHRIEIRVIDVRDSSVDFSFSAEAENDRDFDRIISDAVEAIERFYRREAAVTGFCDITVTAVAVRAAGDFTRGALYGYGTVACFSLNRPAGMGLPLSFCTGMYLFTPRLSTIESLCIVPLEVNTAWPMKISGRILFLPALGAGYLLSRVHYDTTGTDEPPDDYRTSFFYNPALTLRAQLSLRLSPRWSLTLSPLYTIFFESRRIGHLPAAALGTRYAF